MFLKQKLILLTLTLMAGTAMAEKASDATLDADIKNGFVPQLDTGIKVQYRPYSFFVKNDNFAVDVRVYNFYNGKQPTHSYFDLNSSIEARRDEDMLGVPVPIGVVIGGDNNFQAYIQAEPNFDLRNDKDITAGGAVGIRFRF